MTFEDDLIDYPYLDHIIESGSNERYLKSYDILTLAIEELIVFPSLSSKKYFLLASGESSSEDKTSASTLKIASISDTHSSCFPKFHSSDDYFRSSFFILQICLQMTRQTFIFSSNEPLA